MAVELFLTKLAVPLLRLVAAMCVGLLAASILEGLHWTRFVARLAAPLARAGHLRDVSAASFALAFFSPAAANSLLAEAYARGELSYRELVLANLFNSSPTYLVHLPTLFFLVFAFLGPVAFVYVGLTFAASALRTGCTLLAGRLLLPARWSHVAPAPEDSAQGRSWREALHLTLGRFKKRFTKLLVFTVPIYVVFFVAQEAGLFAMAEEWLIAHSGWFAFLNPKSLSIVALQFVAESGAALSAAAVLADTGALTGREIVMALLAGNILSSPVRAVRHQFPSYAGYFTPRLALPLVLTNQACRVVSLVLVAALYYHFAF